VPVPASLHYTDALYGLTVGAVATGISMLATTRRPGWSRAAVLFAAAAAGVVSMFVARGVRRGLIEDVATGAAISVVVVGVLAGVGWWILARYLDDRWLVAVVLITAGGVGAAVPDTEAAIAVTAAWLPFAVWVVVLASRPEPPRWAVLITVGWCALAIVMAWAAAWGASARGSSLPGALACFGIALVAVVPRFVTRSTPTPIPLLVVHVVTVAFAARWAAFAVTISGGAVRSAVVIAGCAIAVGVVTAVSGRRREPEHPPPSVPVPRPR
jgi:hypothetical protein